MDLTPTLNSAERTKWRQIKKRIAENRDSFWLVVEDVRIARKENLFREEYKTFGEFVEAEVGVTTRYVEMLIAANETRESLKRIEARVPEAAKVVNVRPLRELVDVPEDQLEKVIERAAVVASDKSSPMTASVIKQAKVDLGLVTPPSKKPKDAEPVVVRPKKSKVSVGVGREKMVDATISQLVSPLVKQVVAIAEKNGGQGPVFSLVRDHLDEVLKLLKRMRRGEQ